MNRWGFIPPWAPLLVTVAVIFTGVVLGEVGKVFLVLFLLAGIVCTALVELRGLFLTVVMLPAYWFAGIGLVGYFTDRASFSGTGRRTAVITAVYPAIENYLWLVATFIVSLVIAVVRQRLDAAARERARRLARQRRRRTAAAEEDNRRVTSRVRDLERTADQERTAERARAAAARRASDPAQPARPEQSAPRGPRTVTRPRHSVAGDGRTGEVRTRSAEGLRAASERRRARTEGRGDADRPLDLD